MQVVVGGGKVVQVVVPEEVEDFVVVLVVDVIELVEVVETVTFAVTVVLTVHKPQVFLHRFLIWSMLQPPIACQVLQIIAFWYRSPHTSGVDEVAGGADVAKVGDVAEEVT